MEVSSAAEQRADAVAKLKRAASLPRMKNGWRPPMRTEASSEGDLDERPKSPEQQNDEETPSLEETLAGTPPNAAHKSIDAAMEEPTTPVHNTTPTKDGEGDDETTTTPKAAKRRSRSRSRSRGSKDLKAKMKAQESPLQPNFLLPGDATLNPLMNTPRSPLLDLLPVMSPTPSYLAQMQMQMLSPMSPIQHPGTSPPTPMPTLEALQTRHLQGLFRSNSASARMMAMNKLMGVTEPVDPSMRPMSPLLPSPLRTGTPMLGRNNTVAGGERIAVRQMLLKRLNERLEKNDSDQTSGGEDRAPTPTSRSRKRRSKRKSGSTILAEETDHASSSAPTTADTTPTATSAMLAPDVHSRQLSTPTQMSQISASSMASAPSHDRHPLQAKITTQNLEPLGMHTTFSSPVGLRGVVIEDAEDEDEIPVRKAPTPSPHNLGIPETLLHASALRAPHGSHTNTARSSPDLIGGTSVPLMMSQPGQRSPFNFDTFPKTAYNTPVKEQQRRDDDDEKVIYPETHDSGSRFPWVESADREISWAAEPVPEARPQSPREPEPSWIESSPNGLRGREISWISDAGSPSLHVHVEDEDTSFDEAAPEEAAVSDTAEGLSDTPSEFRQSQHVVVEVDTSSDMRSSSTEPSRRSQATAIRESDMSSASALSGATLGATSTQSIIRSQSLSSSVQAWDESATPTETSAIVPKQSSDGLAGTWGKVRNTFSRSNSSSGRRSRANSASRSDRRDNDSSRESGASLNSGKRESRGDGAVAMSWQNSQSSVMQTPSASGSILSLAPPPRTGVSPIPPVSDTEGKRYGLDPKLFPFPGMVRLQEESAKSKGLTSPTSPDIAFTTSMGSERGERVGQSSTSSNSAQSTRMPTEDLLITRKISDSRLIARYQSPAPALSPGTSQTSQMEYINVGSQTSHGQQKISSTKEKEGVRKWLKFFSPQQQDNVPISSTSPIGLSRKNSEAMKKPSLPEMILGRSNVEYLSDWEQDELSALAAPGASISTVKGTSSKKSERAVMRDSSPEGHGTIHTQPRSILQADFADFVQNGYATHENLVTPLPSPADAPSSTTPDPPSSADDSSAQSSHLSASAYSLTSSLELARYSSLDPSPKAVEILQRLEQILKAGDLNKMWSSAMNNPARRLLLSTPMLQVVNANTVKDRFLFLFTDLLIIAKPIMPKRDSLLDNTKPYPPDRKFIVKSVVNLKDLKLNLERDEDSKKLPGLGVALRSSTIRNFVHDFAQDPDIAVYKIVDLRRSQDGYQLLGKLLVQIPELHKGKLGEYLARRSSKPILKAYLDAIGFAGMALDDALRLFLLSIHIPSGPGLVNTLEHLLEVFAGRWYDANAGIVAFDRDLAVRLVRSIIRLNEVLHPSVAEVANGPRHFLSVRDFTEVFRRHDPRCLIPDGMLEKIYSSVRQSKISQARDPGSGRQPVLVTMKRGIPSRLTYKRQSDPIVVRIPQPDSQLSIQIHGKDLLFEPSVLIFNKSLEASFRVTGTSLGPKSLVMTCCGSTAPNYTGLPLSSTVIVERAFMRNTFQLAFLNRDGAKRKYMYSVDDPVIRQEWMSSLKRQIDAVQANIPPDLPSPVQMQVYRAAETLSFSVLQETLLTKGPQRLSPSSSDRHLSGGAAHSRSQSRSQMYSMQADKMQNDSTEHSATLEGSHPPGTHLWASHELEATCQQSSSIALVLSFLQAALPFNTPETEALAELPQPTPISYFVQKPSHI